MDNLSNQNRSGLSRQGLRIWGLLFLVLGIMGRGLFQRELLGIGSISGQQLLELMQTSDNAMLFASLALILQALESCAAPIFAFLLVDGFQRTSSFKNYLLRVAGVAVLSEIPYNLVFSGKVLDTGSRNPVFALLLSLVMLYLFRYFDELSARQRIIKVLVAIAGLLWPMMLRVESGTCIVLLVCVTWAFRTRPMARNIAAATAAVVCTLLTPFFLAAPMGVLVVHFYNEEKESGGSRWVSYLAYPVLLLVIGLVLLFAI